MQTKCIGQPVIAELSTKKREPGNLDPQPARTDPGDPIPTHGWEPTHAWEPTAPTGLRFIWLFKEPPEFL